MSSFFPDDDSDDDPMPMRHPQQPPRYGQSSTSGQRPSKAQSSRQASVSGISDSSGYAASSRQPMPARDRERSFLSRLESTISPRSDRISDSHPSYPPSDRYGRPEVDPSDIGGGMDLDTILGEGAGEEELEGDMDDVRRLGLVWVRERGTADIMRWEGDLIDSVFDKLEQQQKMVDTLRADPQTSEEEHFKLVLVMTEMERVKYLVRSYVRTRLWKDQIEKYSHYIVVTPEIHPLLSGAEMSHARRYTELLHTHFQHSVLDSLPEWLRKMDDTSSDGLSMITKPNKNMPVLIYCRRDCGEINLADGESAALSKGTTHLVKYSLVEQWVKLGWAEVL